MKPLKCKPLEKFHLNPITPRICIPKKSRYIGAGYFQVLLPSFIHYSLVYHIYLLSSSSDRPAAAGITIYDQFCINKSEHKIRNKEIWIVILVWTLIHCVTWGKVFSTNSQYFSDFVCLSFCIPLGEAQVNIHWEIPPDTAFLSDHCSECRAVM